MTPKRTITIEEAENGWVVTEVLPRLDSIQVRVNGEIERVKAVDAPRSSQVFTDVDVLHRWLSEKIRSDTGTNPDFDKMVAHSQVLRA